MKPNIAVGLADEDYWDAPAKTLAEVFEQMSAAQVQGVWLAAPAGVALDVHETLPIIAFRGGSHADVRALSFDKQAVLVAVDVERNRVFAGKAVFDMMGEPPPPSTTPPPNGYLVAPQIIDARDRLGLAWLPTRLRLTLLLRDRVSNRVEVGLGKSVQGYEDPEVARFIARERARRQPLRVWPTEREPLPSYTARSDSPPVPDEHGINLAVERVIPLRANARCLLRGAYRLTALAEERLDDGARPEGLLPPEIGVVRPAPVAIVRISLVLLGADTGTLLVLPMQVPSWELTGEHEITGHFAFDVFAELPELRNKAAQTWFVYAFSGEHMAGPTPFGLVPLELL